MGIRFLCPNGHKLNVKTHLAGKRALCPDCGAKVVVPDSAESTESAVGSLLTDSTWGTLEINPAPPQPAPELPAAEPMFPAAVVTVAEPVAAVLSQVVAPPPVAQLEPAGIPESIVVVPPPPVVAHTPDALTPEELQQIRRERTQRNQILAAIFLFMLVIALAGVLIWVLKRQANSETAEPAPPEKKTSRIVQPISNQIAARVCEQFIHLKG